MRPRYFSIPSCSQSMSREATAAAIFLHLTWYRLQENGLHRTIENLAIFVWSRTTAESPFKGKNENYYWQWLTTSTTFITRRVSIDSLFYHRDGRYCNTRRFAHALTPKPQPTVLPLPDSLLKRFSIARTPEFRLEDRLYQLQVWYCVESIFVLDSEAARGQRQLHVFALNH